MERLRQRGMAMLEDGSTPTQIARALKVARRTVYNWKARGTGEEAKLKKPGPEPMLDARQCRELLSLLEQGASAHGWDNDVWTGRRIAQVIRRRFGVRYHYKYIPVLLRRLGWSWQKPVKRARERNDEKIAEWVRRDWPRIKKKPGARGRR